MEESNKIISTDWMKMDKAPENENYSDDSRFVKLDSKSASQINSVLQVLPSVAAGNALSGAYRVEFPKGLAGAMVPHNDGYLAILRDAENKKFVGQGTLYSLGDVGLMYNVFSGLSLATGQYFMRQINSNLKDIQDKLGEVLDFLYNDKACELYAEAQMVFAIYRNSVSIMRCSEQRIAAIESVHRAKILAERNIQFYYRDMKKLATKSSAIDGLFNDLNNYTQAVSMFGICSVLEIVLSENYDEAFLQYIEKDLKRHVEKHHEEVGQLKGMIINMPKPEAAPFFMPPPKPDPRRDQLINHIDRLLGSESPVKEYSEIISQMRLEYTNRTEYRITSDGDVYKCV